MLRWIRRTLIVLLILLPVFAVLFAANVFFGIDDAYAQWGAVDMVIDHMNANDGKWPPDWEALRPAFERGGGRVGGWSFQKYQSRIAIDFSADADELRRLSIESETVPFRVISARWTIGVAWDDGPNADLHRYFRRKAGIIEAPKPRGGWRTRNEKEVGDNWYGRGFHVQFDRNGNMVAAWTTASKKVPPGNKEVADFKKHLQLIQLNLVGCNVTDDGLAPIKELQNLEDLNLGGCPITDKGLEHLAGHPQLATLDLFGTNITDAGLQRLAQLPKLKSVRIDEERISGDALRKLRAAAPNLDIHSRAELRGP